MPDTPNLFEVLQDAIIAFNQQLGKLYADPKQLLCEKGKTLSVSMAGVNKAVAAAACVILNCITNLSEAEARAVIIGNRARLEKRTEFTFLENKLTDGLKELGLTWSAKETKTPAQYSTEPNCVVFSLCLGKGLSRDQLLLLQCISLRSVVGGVRQQLSAALGSEETAAPGGVMLTADQIAQLVGSLQGKPIEGKVSELLAETRKRLAEVAGVDKDYMKGLEERSALLKEFVRTHPNGLVLGDRGYSVQSTKEGKLLRIACGNGGEQIEFKGLLQSGIDVMNQFLKNFGELEGSGAYKTVSEKDEKGGAYVDVTIFPDKMQQVLSYLSLPAPVAQSSAVRML